MKSSCWARATLATTILAVAVTSAIAQDMLRFLDLKSDDFTKADMTRAEVEAALAAAIRRRRSIFPAGASTA